MKTLGKIRSALTMDGADGLADVLLKLVLIAIAGATFVTGVVLLAAAAQP